MAPYRQHVPRPPDATDAPAGPWTALPLATRASISTARVRQAFSRLGAPCLDVDATAAVLVPLTDRNGEAQVLLIRRSDELRSDPGHIAFPGGHVEEGEAPLEAALRETEEEIALDRSRVEVVGAFAPRRRRRLTEAVLPIVGLVGPGPALVANRGEVDAIVEVPLSALAADGASWRERWGTGEERVEMTFFAGPAELGDDLVWGLSAQVLSELLSAVVS